MELQQERVSEAHNGNNTAENNSNFTKFKQMPRAICNLLKNPTFFFLNLAGASEGLIIAGFAAFLPKQIENQFSVTAVWSALLMGLITVPAGGGGTFLGGYLVKKFNLTCAGIIKLCLITTLIATLFTICFFLSCPNLVFAGVTATYFPFSKTPSSSSSSSAMASTTIAPPVSGEKIATMTMPPSIDKTQYNYNNDQILSTTLQSKTNYQLEHSCNQKCLCNSKNYDPICGVDGVMYYSPCHAGCIKELNMDNAKVYLDCDCIIPVNGTQDRGFDAINTMCETNCSNLWTFVGLCFFVMLFTFLATMPALSATLRLV